jgi:hypothetical protein
MQNLSESIWTFANVATLQKRKEKKDNAQHTTHKKLL